MPLPERKTDTAEDYWNLPEGTRAELINGTLYSMAPPGRVHQRLVSRISARLNAFIDANGGVCEVYPAPFAVNLDSRDKNWVEPDISVVCDLSKLTERGCSGAPDLVIEIVSPSSVGIDCLKKLNLYQKYGVREYWIVNPMTAVVTAYDFAKDMGMPYTFDEETPVAIWNGALKLRLRDLL